MSCSKLTGLVLWLAFILGLTGCSTNSLFSPYPQQIATARQAIVNGQLEKASQVVSGKTGSADKVLYLMEYGRIQQLADNYQSSQKAFQMAIDAVDDEEAKAKITVSGTGVQAGSLLLNDNVIPYSGLPYERILLHQYQALNYLAMGDIEGALVEVRRMERGQQEQEQLQKSVVSSWFGMAQQEGIMNILGALNLKDSKFRYTVKAASQVETQFTNPVVYYLAGVIYEANGNFNQAAVNYRKALALAPQNPYFQQAVKAEPLKEGTGKLVVFFEQGFVPARYEFFSILPIPGAGVVNIKFPVYLDDMPSLSGLAVRSEEENFNAVTAVGVNLYALAARNLTENYPVLFLREGLRQLTKVKLQQKAAEKGQAAGGIAAGLYAVLTAAADLRSWLTLPTDIQVLQTPFQAGTHTFILNYNAQTQRLPVKIVAGHITLVYVTGYAGRFFIKTFVL